MYNFSPSESPVRQTRERIMHSDGASLVRQTRVGVTRHDSLKTARHEKLVIQGRTYIDYFQGQRTDSPHKSTKHSPIIGVQRKIYKEDLHQEKYTREELSGHRSGESRSRLDITEANKNDRDRKSDKASKRIDHPGSPTEEVEYSPGRKDGKISSLDNIPEKKPSSKQLESDSYSNDRLQKANASEELKDHTEKHSHLQTVVDSGRSHNNNRVDAFDSDLKGNGKKGPEHLGRKK
ncbi:hypothetical protein GIB67_032651 [Kingdonia uniflora]|uniref:Uncharacterized protein n=1 Tax=Kingdonia uniflora TaxID=39325 RepID=A0A7J7PA17_9MAGN|nr:hypothetical protein GIB67_032651 [Kingdonia uniflora]